MIFLDLDSLLAPIAGDNPAGADVSYDEVYDKIKEARRQDDPNLAQGDWQAELKIAQWPMVRDLAQGVLSEQSKDLQIAAWLTEAMTQLKGLEGLTDGLTLIEQLKKKLPDAKILLLTGVYFDPDVVRNVLVQTVSAYLYKTTPLKEIIATVKKLIG